MDIMESPEVRGGNVAPNVLLIFRYLYFLYLPLSERSLGGFIDFGGSAQAGEISRHCFVLELADL